MVFIIYKIKLNFKLKFLYYKIRRQDPKNLKIYYTNYYLILYLIKDQWIFLFGANKFYIIILIHKYIIYSLILKSYFRDNS